MFIAPFFLVYCFFQIWPLIYTFILSFQGNQATNGQFVGLDNYTTILIGQGTAAGASATSAEFWKSLGNTFILWFGNFIPQILLSLLLAVWFTDAKIKLPGKGFFKVVMYMPNIITAASVAALYVNLFGESKYYFVNGALLDLGLVEDPIKFISDPVVSKVMVMFIQTWLWFGNTMIMLMSGIMSINGSLFEAAEIDGANSRQTFWRITLPLLKSIMVYTLLTSMIGGFQMFDIPYMYRTGSTINQYIETAAVFIYDMFHANFASPSYGYSASASLILFVITSILGAMVFYVQRDKHAIEIKKKRKQAMKEAKKKAAQGGGLGL